MKRLQEEKLVHPIAGRKGRRPVVLRSSRPVEDRGLSQPSFVGVAVLSVISPIVMRAGEILVAWPEHPTNVLTVTDATGKHVQRTSSFGGERSSLMPMLRQMTRAGVFVGVEDPSASGWQCRAAYA